MKCPNCEGLGTAFRDEDRDEYEGHKLSERKPCLDCGGTGEVGYGGNAERRIDVARVMKPNVTVNVVTSRDCSMELTGAQIKEALGIPADASVNVRVPGGGDWSNTNLDLDGPHTLNISWTETDDE